MNTRLYVGNLPYSVTNEQLHELFSEYGEVIEASVIIDRNSGRSKGFGFVEMANEEDCKAAIEELDDHHVDGRNIKVNEARERESRGGGGGGYRNNRR